MVEQPTTTASGDRYTDYLGNVHKKPAGVAPRWRVSAYALVIRDGKYLMIK